MLAWKVLVLISALVFAQGTVWAQVAGITVPTVPFDRQLRVFDSLGVEIGIVMGIGNAIPGTPPLPSEADITNILLFHLGPTGSSGPLEAPRWVQMGVVAERFFTGNITDILFGSIDCGDQLNWAGGAEGLNTSLIAQAFGGFNDIFFYPHDQIQTIIVQSRFTLFPDGPGPCQLVTPVSMDVRRMRVLDLRNMFVPPFMVH